MEFIGKKILVIGMARSGVAVSALLSRHGANVMINDRKSADELGAALDELKGLPIDWRLGEDPVKLMEEADGLVISPGVPIDAPAVKRARELGKPVEGEIEVAYRLSRGRVAAITGTNGKTTTTTLLSEMFKNAGKTTIHDIWIKSFHHFIQLAWVKIRSNKSSCLLILVFIKISRKFCIHLLLSRLHVSFVCLSRLFLHLLVLSVFDFSCILLAFAINGLIEIFYQIVEIGILLIKAGSFHMVVYNRTFQFNSFARDGRNTTRFNHALALLLPKRTIEG